MCQTLGVALPIQPLLTACGSSGGSGGSIGAPAAPASESVIIVGAGAAGLSAAYLLQQQGLDFQVLEASSAYGGRMKRTTELADFPIPLGAEWIHVAPTILDEIVNDSSVSVNIDTTMYDPATDFGLFEGFQITLEQIGFLEDSKFINSTWFDFFDQYIAPSVQSRISYDTVVQSIDYSGDGVSVETQDGMFSADRVIVTAPVKLLQQGAISFSPPLPQEKQSAISDARVWDGCKAFIRFQEKFYPTFIGFNVTPSTAGQKLYYDAAYGQSSAQHVLGLFAVGTATRPYVDLNDADLIAYMLDELDGLLEGQATPNYVDHVFQNWNVEPYAQGAYVIDDEDWRLVQRLGNSVGDRLFFAGDAYTDGSDWSSVHTAARSARTAVDNVLALIAA